MADALFSIAVVFFLVSLVRNSILWLDIFEQKQFQLKKLFLSFTGSSTYRKLFLNWQNVFKIIFLFVYILLIFISPLADYYPYFVVGIYAISVLLAVRDIFRQKLYIPFRNIPVMMIVLLTIGIDILLLQIPLIDRFAWLLFVEKLSPVFFIILLMGLSVLNDFYRDMIINRAIKKISDVPITTICIMGSKNTDMVKEFLAKILSTTYPVASSSTGADPYTVAHSILKTVRSETKFFIADFHPYNRDQIKEIGFILQPKIGVVTGFDESDLFYFKHTGNILRAYSEFAEMISKSGFVAADTSSSPLRDWYRSLRTKKMQFSHSSKGKQDDMVSAIGLHRGTSTTTITIQALGKKVDTITLRLIGKQSIEALLAAVAVAKHLRIKNSQIKRALEKISPVSGRMEVFVMQSGVLAVNDTLSQSVSSYFDGFHSLEYYKKKRVLVLSPLDDLGREAKSVYYKIGFTVGSIFHTVFLPSGEFASILRKGIHDSGGTCRLIISEPEKIADFLEINLHKGDVVLFEGKRAAEVFNLIEAESVY